MKYLFLAVGLVAIAAAPAAGPSQFDQRADEFNSRWNRFYRSYLGCSAEAHQVKDCKPQVGVLDRKEFERAREAAKAVFDLR